MPSTVVHVAAAALLATALLGDAFDRESALVVLAAAVFVDLDVLVGLVVEGAHRAAFHTYLFPALLAGLAYVDLRVREESLLSRWREDAGRVVGVTVVSVAVAAIGLDMVTNGVNVLYPLHDQFYTVDGTALLSDQRGLVQTFVELDAQPTSGGGQEPRTTNNTHYSTGVDPSKGVEPKDVERKFLLLQSGRDLLLVVAGYASVAVRLWEQGD